MSSDAEGFMPASTAAISAQGTTEGTANAVGDKLPALTIDMTYGRTRMEYMRTQMEYHLSHGMPGVYGDLKDTWAYQSMKKQLDGYAHEMTAFPNAEQAYNQFVAPANEAADNVSRAMSIGNQVGITPDMDVSRLLTPQQEGALKQAYQANPALLQAQNSVEDARQHFEAAKKGLLSASMDMQSILIGDIVTQLQAQITADQSKVKAIQDKIKLAQDIAGYVQKAASIVAAGAGGLASLAGGAGTTAATVVNAEGATIGSVTPGVNLADPTLGTIQKGAGYAGQGAGYLGTAVGAVMELYYAQDLQNLQAKIDSAAAMKTSLEGVAAAAALDARKAAFDEKKQQFTAAAGTYKDAMRDREVAYAKIAADADKNKKNGNGGRDDISQIMLYITTIRESYQSLQSGMSSGGTAKTAIAGAFTAASHRGEGYQTNAMAWGSQTVVESNTSGDMNTLNAMNSGTNTWMGKATETMKTVQTQEQQANALMGRIGASKF